MCAGEISAVKIGAATRAIPTPSPMRMRPIRRAVKPRAMVKKREPVKKRRFARVIVHRRPLASAIMPVTMPPRAAAMLSEPTTNSSWTPVRERSSLRVSIAPAITP
eukprot:scaffold165684_cov32-Tisochrysis_lutea.AAC.1